MSSSSGGLAPKEYRRWVLSTKDSAGVMFFLVFAAAFAGGAYWVWPHDVTEVSLSRLTLGIVLEAGGSILLGLVAFAAICGVVTDAFD